ncbi:sulfite exporter TauE/SafE family protein [uncultured Pseudokineococcus sp.]|uniref:sulfite exporter TauE/SafE family protein n=1 Tax=uncultured Pseudokineococcus sp. TaxID=1642928 RepID=UPI0026221C36|nr:sulfite exporter TauE/SafE family protein [uncultured Pseudokineococcus sp.]
MALFAVPDPGLLVALSLLVAVSSALQTATGFGFAILSAPLGAVLLHSPAAAVTTVVIVGTAVDLLVLLLRRRPPAPRWDEVAVLGISSLPGLALGAYLLVVLPQRLLMIVIAAAVLVAIAFRVASRRAGQAAKPASRRWGAVAGLLSGALATSTTLGGPPTVYYLTHRPHGPATVRDTLVTLNLVRLPLSVTALAIGGVLVLIPGLGWLVLSALAGFFAGDRIFRALDPGRYEVLVLALLCLAALVAVISAFA